MVAKSTLKSYKKTVWKSCATYVKLRESDEFGMVICCTCPRRMSIYDQVCNAGHFVPGHNNTTYFDDAHIFPQCSDCNCGGSGEHYQYGLFLKKKYGYDDNILLELRAQRHLTKKTTMQELKDIKANFDRLSNDLRKEKGLE